MRRKLVQQGPTTLMVSLPSAWIKSQKLKKGDSIEITDKNSTLHVSSSETSHRKSISITFNSSNYQYIRALIRNLYTHGFEHIAVKYHNKIDFVSVTKAIDDLDGFEMSKETPTGCIIENVSDIKYDKFTIFYEKQYQIIKTIENLLEQALAKKATADDLEIIQSLWEKNSKYACICRRCLTKHQLMNNDKALIIFSIIFILHIIARSYLNCYLHLNKTNMKVHKQTLSFFYKCKELFSELYLLHVKKKKESKTVTELRDQLISKTMVNAFSKVDGSNAVLIHFLAEAARLSGTTGPKIELMNNVLDESIEY